MFNIGAPLAVVNTVAGVGLSGAIFSGLVGFGLSASAAYLSSTLLRPGKPRAPTLPTPEDGKFNLKQNVPSLTFVYGRRKKGGDYVLLEERSGTAYHLLVHVAHEIEGYVDHYLGDAVATLDVDGFVTSVDSEDEDSEKYYVLNGVPRVRIQTRKGLDIEQHYATLVDVFPEIWSTDHRGDGLASALMSCDSVGGNDYTTTYPNGMPSHNAVLDGRLCYDPRDGVTRYTTNLGLIRLDHLLSPFGGKQTLDAFDLESMKAFADVCDEDVVNRNGEVEKRYHGGLWGRYENDPVDVGREIDEAADAVLYETAEGKIAVHPGHWVEPDIHLTEDDIISFSYIANRDPEKEVIATRGRWIDPGQDFNKVDAALYGDPYVSENDERTRTVDNECVDKHNHISRMQKLRYIRARAPRVAIKCDYWSARNIMQRRFIRVTKSPHLVSQPIEIIGRPKRILYPNLAFEFEGLVVPSTLYDFVAATEEGEPGSIPVKVGSSGIPDVENFDVTIQSGDIGGGVGAYALATFTNASDALTYQLEFEQTSGGAVQNAAADNGNDEIQTGYLLDGSEYKFRIRAVSGNGSYGDWTDYITRTAVADTVAPGLPVNVTVSGSVGQADLAWTNPNSANLKTILIYRNSVDDFATASLIEPIHNGAETYSDTGLTAGSYFYWLTAANGSGVESAEVSASPSPVIVT